MTLKRGGRRANRATADRSSDWGAATTQHTHSVFLGIISFVLVGSLLPSHPKGVHFWGLANPLVFFTLSKTPRALLAVLADHFLFRKWSPGHKD